MIPDRMLYDGRLEPMDIRLWGVMLHIGRFRGYCHSTDNQLAAKLRVSPQTIRRSLLRLERSGYISRGRGDDGGRRIDFRPDGDLAAAEPGIQVVG